MSQRCGGSVLPGTSARRREIPIRCFQLNPSIKSSLTFLRRTPWARAKVEELYRRSVARPSSAP
ncbi:MAG TPA: VF530 family DNA-binding protein [Polyangiaceae bacterium]|nr:VF530 family DNA-binding protein [Polyangiaceae bacterium]